MSGAAVAPPGRGNVSPPAASQRAVVLSLETSMPSDLAQTLVTALAVYAAVGLVFAVPFVLVGAGRVDPSARGGTWGFRLVILPGAAALWPLLLARWLRGSPPPVERTAHKRAAGVAWPERAP